MSALVTSIARMTNAQKSGAAHSPGPSPQKDSAPRGWSVRLSRVFGPPSGPSTLWLVVLEAVVLTSIWLLVPGIPPDLGADASWCGVLTWAHGVGLQFGKDIVFTYGPLGYLIAPYTLTPPSQGLLLFNVALCFGISVGACQVARRLGLFWRCLFLGVMIFGLANAPLRADLLLQLGLFCWGLLCFTESGRIRRISVGAVIILAAFAALAKVVYLYAAGFYLCAIAFFLWCTGGVWLSYSLLPGFLAVLLSGWVVAGQQISNFGRYVFVGFLLSRDYDQAVALPGLEILRDSAFILALVSGVGLLLRVSASWEPENTHLWKQRGALALWVAGTLFFAWKHSVVRLDRDHIADFVVLAPLVLAGLELVPAHGSKRRLCARCLTLVCSGLALLVVQFALAQGPPDAIKQIFRQADFHLRCFLSPNAWRRLMERDLQKLYEDARLPQLASLVGSNTVDVFGLHQSYALLNRFNYRPRPIFQSYAAFTDHLEEINREFYRSELAPEFVLFELSSLEHRFPSLDDARALRELLVNYQWIAHEGPFQLLKHRIVATSTLKLVEQRDVALSARIVLPKTESKTFWMEMDLKPSVLGDFIRFLYRPEPIRLSVWQDSMSQKPIARRQTAPSLLHSGFLASPFLIKPEEIAGQTVTRPGAFSLEPAPGTENLWKGKVIVRVYEEETAGPVLR